MTSLERQDGNMYGGVREPAYGILTYTWGRWSSHDGPHIDISGVSWRIPAVNEVEAFTVAEFQEVVRKMGEVNKFAWVDVACIDQENNAVKMDEIGNQVGIFAKADSVFVWLWKLPAHSLQAALDDIFYCSMYLQLGYREELDRDLLTVLTQLKQSVDALLDDWWFTSLWTLQEGILRRDALVLARDAQPIQYSQSENHAHVYTRFISNTLWNLRLALEDPFCSFKEPPYSHLSLHIVERIKKAGYATKPFALNPNIQYAAAQFRKTSDSLDRIYGITSIYNLRVGASAPGSDISRHYTFEELETEFTIALNAKSPLLGQMFIHTDKSRETKTWQISQKSKVIMDLTDYRSEYQPSECCEISGSSCEYAQVEGSVCSLHDLYAFWLASESGFYYNIMLDASVSARYTSIPSFPDSLIEETSEVLQQTRVITSAVLREFPENRVSVLALGKSSSSKARPNPTVNFFFSMSFGLVLLHNSTERRLSERLGICVWNSIAEPHHGGTDIQWVKYSGKLY